MENGQTSSIATVQAARDKEFYSNSIGTAIPPANIDDVREKTRKADHEKTKNIKNGEPLNDYDALKAVFLEVLGNNNISADKQTEYKKRVGM